MFETIIIGAGFAGAVIAERLATQLNQKVLIIEKRNHTGGNCYDYRDDNGIIVHKYGPHLFHTDNQEVWKYLSCYTEWEVYHHEVLAYIDGKKVPIPFNLNTIYEVFPVALAMRIEEKLLTAYEYNTKVPILELKKSTDTDLQYLADFVYEKIFLHYTAKQWGMKPEEMDSAVTARVPIFVGRDNRYFNERYQGVPKHGYTKMFQQLLNHPNIKLMLNTEFQEVMRFDGDKILFLDKEFNGKVVFTGMIDELFGCQFGELPYRSVDMRVETIERNNYQEAATINYPNNYEFTRITEFKQIHFTKSDRTTILKEYPEPYRRGENTPYYPIFTEENKAGYNKYVDYAKRYANLILLGRLAEYRYYDMDDIVEMALKIYKGAAA
ncbi:MAG: UDP-galactopyranose mutase [Firmicutes bacterium]|nr:UDP-galactopyranose mutase [Bacillota bacterium]